ncbi:hypothetical protein CYLTODRAFT_446000 [Cylindrobasidium torrendii FP15055 ss-10]|uniref:DUF7587 domain-containing protein n=1 Tax=Cylindrobasidium torrendii FP15055 ss-10 TaxID=1314674 RepID=A0A0D7B1E8_9AGAR|nr:hypothetical protein CYLTODRAFT_446000 [Cylindrobasidium torrendii FP15055 ss-10]
MPGRPLLFRVVERKTDLPNVDNGAYESGFTRLSRAMPQDTHQAEKEYIIRHVTLSEGNSGRSPFLSTSASFLWCMWEAGRRAQKQKKRGVSILILDASPLEHDGLLRRLVDAPYREWFLGTKFYTWIDNSREVLVKNSIPRSSVIGRIQYADIQKNPLPFYPLDHRFEYWNAPHAGKASYGSFSLREGDVLVRFRSNTHATNFDSVIQFVRALNSSGAFPQDVAFSIAENLVFACANGILGAQPYQAMFDELRGSILSLEFGV